MEAPDGYGASNGQCSPVKEKSRMLADMSTPNGQTLPLGPNSPAEELSIKQEDEAGEEADGRSPPPEELNAAVAAVADDEEGGGALGDSMSGSPSQPGHQLTTDAGSRQPNGDRPFQCNQCGVSFTQKGNLLRHIKLHTGEKPFKCPFCSYACRRRDALTGHLRTHAVGKPHKCNYCGRSYKQRTSLEEHKERCHSYLQSIGLEPTNNIAGPFSGEAPKEPRPMAAFDRPLVIEKLHSNVGKRKSTTPQKFVGEKLARYSYPELSYEMGLKYEKQGELLPAHVMEPGVAFLGSEALRPFLHHAAHPAHPLSMAEVMPMVNPLFQHVLPMARRTEQPGSCDALQPPPPPPPPVPLPPSDYPAHPASNGPIAMTTQQQQQARQGQESPNNSDSPDSARSSPRERRSYQPHNPPAGLRSRGSPAIVYPGERAADASPRGGGGGGGGGSAGVAALRAAAVAAAAAERPSGLDAVRVFGREGQELRAFQCEHCRVLFLDHVMYTIHMGCHGYREPLECNICGHRSKDRYEFSSHIVRGEHTFH